MASYNWPRPIKNFWLSYIGTVIREKVLLFLCGSFDVRSKGFGLNAVLIKSGQLALNILFILIHENNM